jgi:hypothetical protein
MSDTPETDAIVRNAATADHPPTRLAATLTVKCEKLERERDEAREERDIARLEFEEISNERYEEIQKVLKERDEAREILLEIAEANGFDNIGNWARNKAKSSIYR